MVQGIAPQGRAPRTAAVPSGILLLVGAGLMFAGGGLPFVTSLGGEAWTRRGTQQLAVIADAPTAWFWANGLILAGTVLTVAGLAAATPWLEHHGVLAWGRASVVIFTLGAGMWAAALVMRMSITIWVAETAGPRSPAEALSPALDAFQERALDVFMVLGLGGLALIGLALAPSVRPLSVALLLVAALAAGLAVAERIPAFVYLGTAVLGGGMLFVSPGEPARPAP